MAVVAAWVTSQLVFNGLIAGLEIGLLAMGIVLIYRSTRVINFAVGNMGLVGASLLALLVIEYDIPFWLAAIGSLVQDPGMLATQQDGSCLGREQIQDLLSRFRLLGLVVLSSESDAARDARRAPVN